MRAPFVLKRPLLLFGHLFLNRNRPALERLAATTDAETFVWRMLPHAARTFAACIIMLPRSLARAAAVAYLYCRILDTCEDLIPDEQERDQALETFGLRLAWQADGQERSGVAAQEAGALAPEPNVTLDAALARDDRDAAHILLVHRCDLVDQVFVTLDPQVQAIIIDLVREMSNGMRWSSRAFARQGGALADGDQLARYCWGVLGTPMLFATRLIWLRHHGHAEVTMTMRANVQAVGEFLQLANITRDLEKDLGRGIAYDPRLAPFLHGPDGLPGPTADAKGRGQVLREVRSALLDRALAKVPAYRRLVDGLETRRMSLSRASAVLMLGHTERYYRRCTERCGRVAAGSRRGGLSILMSAFVSFWSPRAADRILRASERRLLALAPVPPQAYQAVAASSVQVSSAPTTQLAGSRTVNRMGSSRTSPR